MECRIRSGDGGSQDCDGPVVFVTSNSAASVALPIVNSTFLTSSARPLSFVDLLEPDLGLNPLLLRRAFFPIFSASFSQDYFSMMLKRHQSTDLLTWIFQPDSELEAIELMLKPEFFYTFRPLKNSEHRWMLLASHPPDHAGLLPLYLAGTS